MVSNAKLELAAEAGHAVISDDRSADVLAMTELLPVVTIPLTALAGGFDLRLAGDDSAHVRLLAEAAADSLPPILVQRSSSRVIDGMHRVAAAKLRRDAGIRARLVDCTDAQALVLAMRSNSAHGLPLSRADRVAGARHILAAHPGWSDRAVAEVAGMSAKAIASLRGGADTPSQPEDKRLGRDGKWRPVNAAEGRRRVAQCLTAHPEASLRELARAAGVSLGTAHDVKEQLRAGADPGAADDAVADADNEGTAGPGTAAVRSARPKPTRQRATESGGPEPSLPMIMAKLAVDPSLRYTDSGRAFLRWMTRHAIPPGEWREFADAVPEYWLTDIGDIAAAMSEEWLQFSLLLRNKAGS